MLENFRKLFPGGSGGGQSEQVVSLEHLREILDTIEVKFGQMKTEYASYRETTEAQLAKAAELERACNRLQQERENLTNQGGGELTIMGRDGQIRSKDTIAPGRDPNPPKDKEH